MQHVVVTRTALVVAGLLVAASLAFAWCASGVRPPPGAPPPGAASGALPGEAAFRAHCARCHTVEEVLGSFPEARAATAAAKEVLSFLEDHGDVGLEQDRAIVDFLWAEVWRRRDAPARPPK